MTGLEADRAAHGSPADGGLRSRPLRLAVVGAVVVGVALGASWLWMCDDAYISFRYARNFVEGQGLVFNPGERVEGMTNPAWTLWIAAGMALGVAPEAWSGAWGLLAHAGTIALLALLARRWRRRLGGRGLLPVGAIVAALHPDLAVWATSGLETSAFTALILSGFALVTADRPRAPAAGVVLALASVTRPDGVLIVAACGAYLLARGGAPRAWLGFAAGFAALYLPATLARVGYYGDFLPNTYYAKSAGIAWYEQGLVYVALYLQRSWSALLGVPAALLLASAGWRRGWISRTQALDAGLAVALVLAYTAYVARVGGDFMYARLLVPITPLALTLLDWSLQAASCRWPGRELARAALAAASIGAMLWITPAPVSATRLVRGITDERDSYRRVAHAWLVAPERGATLRHYLDGLDVRAAFIGGEARLMYEARIPVAVECETGLTDRRIARQPLGRERGRVGHEKHAPPAYIVEERRLHFAFHPIARRVLGLNGYIPNVPIVFPGRNGSATVTGSVLHWDPALMRVLAERGARFPDFPRELDTRLEALERMPAEEAAAEAERLRRFYFAHVDDPRAARLAGH